MQIKTLSTVPANYLFTCPTFIVIENINNISIHASYYWFPYKKNLWCTVAEGSYSASSMEMLDGEFLFKRGRLLIGLQATLKFLFC